MATSRGGRIVHQFSGIVLRWGQHEPWVRALSKAHEWARGVRKTGNIINGEYCGGPTNPQKVRTALILVSVDELVSVAHACVHILMHDRRLSCGRFT